MIAQAGGSTHLQLALHTTYNKMPAEASTTVYSKEMDHQTHGGNFCQILTDFQNSFIVRLSDKFAVMW